MSQCAAFIVHLNSSHRHQYYIETKNPPLSLSLSPPYSCSFRLLLSDMNPRRPNSPPTTSLKLIVYVTIIIFLVLTSLSMILGKFYSIAAWNHRNPNLHRRPAAGCAVPEYKRRLIGDLEPLIAEEPTEVWEGLGKQEKNIKYLPTMSDLRRKNRLIYIDVGARDYESSIGSWFEKQYPKQNRSFEIYAVEADRRFHGEYRSKEGVALLPYAAWIRNETVVFGSKPIVVGKKVWRMRPFGRIEGAGEERDGVSAVERVAAFDFVDWLKTVVRPAAEDFVVVKMDVEGTEIKLIEDMVRRGAICLVDELFMECHFDRYVKCCSGQRINRFNYSYDQCYTLFSGLREMGVVVHQWW
ncbi:uncharacterized protein LOC127259719 [Andrographis paniculata]|uniref:uncharacterized protein LOC127259719 n=1 Tax=Andrographis paniculata TaxID=175694 RepID=UPI0021E71E3F|nr:uncharacterized protein LOC127259719 [Andrographis paniculata]